MSDCYVGQALEDAYTELLEVPIEKYEVFEDRDWAEVVVRRNELKRCVVNYF